MGIDEYALHERVKALEILVADWRAQSAGAGPHDSHLARLAQISADLRALIGPVPKPWWERMAISPDLEEEFEEAMRLGREFRRTGRIPEDDADTTSKRPGGSQFPPEEPH
jgi:hypothetical protein